MLLTRYNPNGTLDNSFDGDGKLVATFVPVMTGSMLLQFRTTERLVVAGCQCYGAGHYEFCIGPLQCKWQLDNSFDGDGKLPSFLARSGTQLC